MPSPPEAKANKTVGARIKEARLAAGLTQQQLAGKDFTRGFISQIENEFIQPSLPSLRIIAARLNKPVSWFLEQLPPADVEPPKPPARKWAVDTLDDNERTLIKLFRQGTKDDQQLILAFARWVLGKRESHSDNQGESLLQEPC